jgi:hypothetical protein
LQSDEQLEAGVVTRRTVSIKIETERLLVVLRGTSARVWCEQCGTEVDMVPIKIAAELAQVDADTIQLLLDKEKFHSSQPGGPVQICLKSLLKELV